MLRYLQMRFKPILLYLCYSQNSTTVIDFLALKISDYGNILSSHNFSLYLRHLGLRENIAYETHTWHTCYKTQKACGIKRGHIDSQWFSVFSGHPPPRRTDKSSNFYILDHILLKWAWLRDLALTAGSYMKLTLLVWIPCFENLSSLATTSNH